MRLYRPVGLRELELIAQSNFKAFPPRLLHQPIFYPVVDLEYARQIARDWNAPDEFSGYIGFVTQFDVRDTFARQFPIQTAGATCHRELWIPAERLDEFNQHLEGPIVVVEAFPGARYAGLIDETTQLPRGL